MLLQGYTTKTLKTFRRETLFGRKESTQVISPECLQAACNIQCQYCPEQAEHMVTIFLIVKIKSPSSLMHFVRMIIHIQTASQKC